jgi:hypothetical protein
MDIRSEFRDIKATDSWAAVQRVHQIYAEKAQALSEETTRYKHRADYQLYNNPSYKASIFSDLRTNPDYALSAIHSVSVIIAAVNNNTHPTREDARDVEHIYHGFSMPVPADDHIKRVIANTEKETVVGAIFAFATGYSFPKNRRFRRATAEATRDLQEHEKYRDLWLKWYTENIDKGLITLKNSAQFYKALRKSVTDLDYDAACACLQSEEAKNVNWAPMTEFLARKMGDHPTGLDGLVAVAGDDPARRQAILKMAFEITGDSASRKLLDKAGKAGNPEYRDLYVAEVKRISSESNDNRRSDDSSSALGVAAAAAVVMTYGLS